MLNLAAHRLIKKIVDILDGDDIAAAQTEAWNRAWQVDLDTTIGTDIERCKEVMGEGILCAQILSYIVKFENGEPMEYGYE